MGKSKEMFMDQQETEQNTDQTTERQEADLMHSVKVSREFIGNAVINAVESVRSGNVPALEALTHLSAMEKFIKDVKDQIRPWIVDEAMKYPKGIIQLNGCELKMQEAGTKYDYASTGDPEYLRLKEALKKRETFLKGISKSEVIADQETGEMITINPPIKSSTTTVAVTIL